MLSSSVTKEKLSSFVLPRYPEPNRRANHETPALLLGLNLRFTRFYNWAVKLNRSTSTLGVSIIISYLNVTSHILCPFHLHRFHRLTCPNFHRLSSF